MTKLTPQDVNKYLTTIRINFENSYKTQNDEERQILIKSWFAILKDYPKEVCDVAVINAIKHAEYAPRIGAIVKEIEKMQVAYEKTETELWGELTGVLRDVARQVYCFPFNFVEANGLTQGDNARRRVKEIFNALSPELKEYCRDDRGLIELSQYTDQQLTFEKGRFQKTLPQLKQRMKTRHETGDQVAMLVQGMSVYLSTDDGQKLLEGASNE